MSDVIYVYVNPETNYIVLTKKELEDLLDKAYQQGRNSHWYWGYYPTYYSTTPSYPYGNTISTTGTSKDYNITSSVDDPSKHNTVIFTTSSNDATYGIATPSNV